MPAGASKIIVVELKVHCMCMHDQYPDLYRYIKIYNIYSISQFFLICETSKLKTADMQ